MRPGSHGHLREVMVDGTPPALPQVVARLCSTVFIVAACTGLIAAAALLSAPPAVLPLLVLVCIAGPMLAAIELAHLAPHLRGLRSLARHRRALEALPETEHPLGL